MARRYYSNNALETTISAGITSLDDSLSVVSALGYPATPFVIVLDPDTDDEEFILVGTKLGTVFSDLTRGWDGSIPASHIASAIVKHVATALDFTEIWTHRHLASEGHTPLLISTVGRAKGRRTSATEGHFPGVGFPWPVSVYDSHGYHNEAVNPSRFTVPVDSDMAGTYSMHMQLNHGSFVSAALSFGFLKNGVEVSRGPYLVLDGIPSSSYMETVYLAEGDYVEGCYFTDGTPESLAMGFLNSYMLILRIGD